MVPIVRQHHALRRRTTANSRCLLCCMFTCLPPPRIQDIEAGRFLSRLKSRVVQAKQCCRRTAARGI